MTYFRLLTHIHVYSETMPYFDCYMKVYEEEMKMNTGDLETLSFTSVDQVEHRLSTPLVQTYLGNYYHSRRFTHIFLIIVSFLMSLSIT